MTFSVSAFGPTLLLLAGLALSGCVPSAQSQLDEEREPHFLAGKSRVSALDYPGAIEAFEKALEVNPQSAAAHFELACLFHQEVPDPAAAVYHFQKYLKLRPTAENTEIVRQRILACKQQLAGSVLLGPVTEKLQRDFDQLAQENKHLREDLEKARAYATWLQTLTNQAGAKRLPNLALGPSSSMPPSGASSGAGPGSSGESAVATSPSQRTHTVKAGETPILIARKYGVRLDALMGANPRLDARKLKVGQTLSIPPQ